MVSSWSNPMIASDWDIRREGRRWSDKEFDQRIVQAPEKIWRRGNVAGTSLDRRVNLTDNG
jgi:hypothetical protein